MVRDRQVRRLFMLKEQGLSLDTASLKSGMSENTARKYLNKRKLPSQLKKNRNYRTRKDLFEEVWNEIEPYLLEYPKVQATTLFDYLQRTHPGMFKDSQLRSLQRKIKNWKALNGKPKEAYFEQVYKPGVSSESDFTHMGKLGITIQGVNFDHLIYHFVLCYSNWEYACVCYSENYETLSECLQKAIWKLGSIPKRHKTDCMSAVLKRKTDKDTNDKHFIDRYNALLRYYKIKAERTNPYSPNENGDVEQSHHRLKKAVEQALILKGSKDFNNQKEYTSFIESIIDGKNINRKEKLSEEIRNMKALPPKKLLDHKRLEVRVTKFSTIRVANCIYSVHSRLIGEKVNIRLYSKYLEIYYSGKLIDSIPRQKGNFKCHIQYEHVIDSLIRKPGAFENYKYKNELFPNTRFRMVYDYLKQYIPSKANKEYLKILYLCTKEGESIADDAIRYLMDIDKPLSYKYVAAVVLSRKNIPSPSMVTINDVNLFVYDELLSVASRKEV